MSDLTKQLGQLFIIGYPGPEPPRPFMNFLSEEQIGGVILFEENCPVHHVARDAIRRIRAESRNGSPFIAIDQEGGRISRLRGAPAEFRAAAEYGADGSVERFHEEYRRSVLFMESLGINLNFSPVCDLFIDANSTCLIGRCFGETPQQVIPFIETAISTARAGGLLSCLKHFPGLGATAIDPHFNTPIIRYDEMVWEQRERLPFAAGVAAGADMIMTTHVRLLGYDDTIATGSQKVVQDLLRKRLAFDGPVVTDDLSMLGASELGNIGQRTVTAFNAGHDLLLFGKDYELSMQAYRHFVDAFRRGEISDERVQAALDRVAGVKFKLDTWVEP